MSSSVMIEMDGLVIHVAGSSHTNTNTDADIEARMMMTMMMMMTKLWDCMFPFFFASSLMFFISFILKPSSLLDS